MSASTRSLAVLAVAAGFVAGLVTSAPAGAVPDCTNTGPTTTQCERPGNAQINTGPPFNTYNNFPWPTWGGGISIGIGGIGI